MDLTFLLEPVHPGDFYIKPDEGAALQTLLRRVAYGGRKGRSAVRRINANRRRLNPVRGTDGM